MVSIKSSIALGFLFGCCASCCLGQAAKLRDAAIATTAIATKAEVGDCFAQVRGLEPERLPPAYLVLRLTVAVSYRKFRYAPHDSSSRSSATPRCRY
jgi:hypothetical protein